MKVKALISFGGIISMAIREIRDIDNKEIVKDLVQAGYVEIVGKTKNTEEVLEKLNVEKKPNKEEEVITNED